MKRLLIALSVVTVWASAALAQVQPGSPIQVFSPAPSNSGGSLVIGTTSISGGTPGDCLVVTTGPVINQAGCTGSPGGSTTQVQFNSSGSFGGVPGFTFDGTSVLTLGQAGTSIGGLEFNNLTSGNIEILPPTGALGSSVWTLQAATDTFVGRATTDTLTNKSIAGSEINSSLVSGTVGGTGVNNGAKTITLGANFATTGAGAATLAFGASSFTYTVPNATDTFAMLAATQTFTNKTLTSPTINAGAISGTFTGNATFSGNLTMSGTDNFTGTFEIGGKALALGTLTDGDLCTWTASGTTLNCTTTAGGTGNANFGTASGNTANHVVTMANTTTGVKDSGSLLPTPDGQTIVASASNVFSVTAPNRTASAPTIASTDMGGQVNASAGTVTVGAISSTLFEAGAQLVLANTGTGPRPLTGSGVASINAGAGCNTAFGIPQGDTWFMTGNSGTSIDCIQTSPNNATVLATGSSTGNTLTAPRQYFVCTAACTVTPPVPAAGYEFCVLNGNNISGAITLGALGSSAMYQNTAATAYGTAGTGTLASGGATGDKVCIVGLDATHYITTSFNGTWTAS